MKTPAGKRKLDKLFAQVSKNFRSAASDPRDAAAIHALRTSSRRFSQALVLYDAGDQRMRRSLKKMITACGLVRDLDMLFAVLSDAHTGQSKPFREELHSVRKEAQRKLARKLRRWRKRDIVSDWKNSLLTGGRAPAIRPSVHHLMVEFFYRGDRAVEPGRSYKKVHRFRVLSKQLRYSLELTEPRGSAKLLALKGLQDRLGALNDCVVAIDLVSGVSPGSPVVARNIRRLLPRKEQEFQVYWRNTFPAPGRARWLKEYR
jgi:CHAD domain-containing protein